jgi:CIC family chloride channel protein
MAAAFAAVARAPLTAVLIVFETTGDYGLVLPLIIATAIATVLGNRVHPESAYTMQLSRMGIRVSRRGEIDLLDTVKVGDVTSGDPVRVGPDLTLGELQGVLDHHRLHGLPVVEEQDRLIGIIAITDIVRAGGPSDQVRVGDVMTPRPATVTPETPVSEAMERMAVLGVGRLPVVSEHAPDQLIGIFRREDAVNAYHQALAETTRERVGGDRFLERTHSDAEFFKFEIPAHSVADGRPIREVPWPEGCILVSVHRGPEVFVANGDITLQDGDVITGFAGKAGRRRLVERLAISADGAGQADAVQDPRPRSGDEPEEPSSGRHPVRSE